MSAIQDFSDRKYYKYRAYPEEEGFGPLDLWYEKNLYGKVNKMGEPIYLSESNLKALSGTEDLIFAADFVADAYEDMKNYYKKMALMKRIRTSGTVLGSLKPKRGWSSTATLHHAVMEIIYQSFVVIYLRSSRKENEVITFNDFMNIFLEFANVAKDLLPITRSSFILSSRCSPMTSGLMIELDTSSHNEDAVKEKVIADPNFSFYKKTAKRFGFKIDKNAPWRLIANVSSARMQKYMEKYGIALKPGTASNLFELYYYNAKNKDVEFLRSYCSQFYNSYVAAYPTVRQISTCKNGNTLHSKMITRHPITAEEMDSQYGGLYWMEIYLNIKMSENKKEFSNILFNKKLKRMLEIMRIFGIDSAVDYVIQETK